MLSTGRACPRSRSVSARARARATLRRSPGRRPFHSERKKLAPRPAPSRRDAGTAAAAGFPPENVIFPPGLSGYGHRFGWEVVSGVIAAPRAGFRSLRAVTITKAYLAGQTGRVGPGARRAGWGRRRAAGGAGPSGWPAA